MNLTAQELADTADQWFEANKKRLAADKIAASLKAEEDGFKAILLREFQEQKLTGIGGKKVRVGMDPVPDYVPAVKDWPAYYDYIVEHRAFELLQRRPGVEACRERWERGVAIPGCEKFPVFKLTKQGV